MTSVVDPDTWDTITTQAVGFAADTDPDFRTVIIAYRRVAGEWVPWVMVAQSAALVPGDL